MKTRLYCLGGLCLVLSYGCTSYEKIPYLQDIEAVNTIQEIPQMYDAKIRPKDLLTITVNTTDPEVAAPLT